MITNKRLLYFGMLVMIFSVFMAGCGGNTQLSAESAGTAAGESVATSGQSVASLEQDDTDRPTVTVTIKDFKFEPANITAPPGTRIVFVNEDPTPHNVVQGNAREVSNQAHEPLFESPEIDAGETWELILDEVGEYDYACTVAGHYMLDMEGTISIVEGAEITVAGSDSADDVDDTHDHAAHHAAPVLADLAENLIPMHEGLVQLEPFNVEGNLKEFAIDIQEVTHELVDGVTVTAWAFNGTVPGPLLRVTEGDLVRVHFTNTHHQPHTIHWHGIYADQEYDGVPHTSRAVMPGETYVYEFVADNAGTYMYHCHVDSYRHIDMGMYGGLVIDPAGPALWDREYTLVLDDWDSNVEPMASIYKPEHNYFLINGKAFPDVPSLPIKVGETTRIRLINAGYHNFAMHLHGPHFEVVATDGYELPVPYMKDTIDVAPGERYDIEITPTKAGSYPFHAHNIQFVLNDGHYPGGMHLMIDILDEDAEI